MNAYRDPPDGTGLLDRLARVMERHAAHGAAAPLFGAAELSLSAGAITAAAISGYEVAATSCDNVVLTGFRCEGTDGVLEVACGGNYKDEACGVAAAAAADAFIEAFAVPLPAGVDVPPALRRAMLAAHDAVRELAAAPLGARVLHTVMGRRSDLRGIGVCVTAAAVLPQRVWTAHVGDGHAYVVREGRALSLTLAHTLANEPAFRAAAGAVDRDFARLVVTRALGVTEACPPFDVARADLERRDRVVVGNIALDPDLAAAALPAAAGEATPPACTALARAMRASFPGAPATVGIIDVR